MKPAEPPPAGLCETCMHARRVASARGSIFVRCDRSREDARYPKYPRLPVIACAGYEHAKGEDGDGAPAGR